MNRFAGRVAICVYILGGMILPGLHRRADCVPCAVLSSSTELSDSTELSSSTVLSDGAATGTSEERATGEERTASKCLHASHGGCTASASRANGGSSVEHPRTGLEVGSGSPEWERSLPVLGSSHAAGSACDESCAFCLFSGSSKSSPPLPSWLHREPGAFESSAASDEVSRDTSPEGIQDSRGPPDGSFVGV